jgi:hypothetical protein
MAKDDVKLVAALGDIEIDIEDATPQDIALRLPLTMQDGTKIILQLEKREMRQLWEFLSAVRYQKPAAFGVQ